MNKHVFVFVSPLLVILSSGLISASNVFETMPPRDPFFLDLAAIFGIVNITLCVVLIIIYLQIWRKTHSEFTIGLMILSFALLLHSLLANPIVSRTFGYPHLNLGPFSLLPILFTTISLGVLLYLASR